MQKSIIQLHGLQPSEVLQPIKTILDEIKALKSDIKTSKRPELLSKKEAASYLKITLKTLDNWTKKGTLNSYGIEGRVYYKLSELRSALIKLNSRGEEVESD